MSSAGRRSGYSAGFTFSTNYDNLYRSTNATYSPSALPAVAGQALLNGGVFTYTYDAVGNRQTQTILTTTTFYTYDVANRLTNVGSITYTWDKNGNLLSDGVYSHTYDSADRLITSSLGRTPTPSNTTAWVIESGKRRTALP